MTSDIRLQGGTINTNGSSISTRYGGICITGSAQVTAGSLSTGGDPNTEEAQRARDLVISGRASVTAERLSALQQIQITGSATVTVENPAGIAINGNRGIAISEQARVTAIGTTAVSTHSPAQSPLTAPEKPSPKPPIPPEIMRPSPWDREILPCLV